MHTFLNTTLAAVKITTALLSVIAIAFTGVGGVIAAFELLVR